MKDFGVMTPKERAEWFIETLEPKILSIGDPPGAIFPGLRYLKVISMLMARDILELEKTKGESA